MRKISKRRKKLGMSGLLFIFLFSLASISIGYSLLSEQIQVNGKATVVTNNDTNDDDKLRMTYQKNTWGSNPYITQFDVTLENISDEVIDSWTLYIEIPENTEIVNAWGVIASIENDKLILKNETYNGNISIDGKITFGIQIQSNTPNLELDNSISDTGEEDDEKNDEIIQNGNLIVSYNIDNKWQDASGYHTIYSVTINNIGDPIYDWSMKINLPNDTTYESSWSCNYIVQDNSIIFSNMDYNGNIETNASVTFGFAIVSQSDNIELITEYISSD